ncbi:exported hypothetical protein [Paraburkholderia piptadeniae]|uniref:Uncharacterized protein n=1 Tax=Paraburkholderia piptadeniae TaxID=1701573 RepID=A0A1N7SDY1_9BURK|nr:hypothetical protein [Paraburkholderia piptadeniae]SIT45532.1 exported hypothetical protein [Paraburkholderia piptadeniae]
MMELIIAGGTALALGAWATVLLATHIPEQLLIGGQDHGRYAYLGEDGDVVDATSSNSIDIKPFRPAFADARSRARHYANPLRESRRRRAIEQQAIRETITD